MTPLRISRALGRNERLLVGPPDEGIAGAPALRAQIDDCIEHLDRRDVETLRDLCEEALQ